MDQNLYQKLSREDALTAEESLRLDTMLEQTGQADVWVSQIEEPAMSLAWRSSLNDQLIKRSAMRRQTRFWSFGSTAVAVAASAFALFMVQSKEPINSSAPMSSRPTTNSGPLAEGALVRAHNDAVVQASLGVTLPSESGSSPFDWSTIESL